MLNVSGMVTMVRNAGMATAGSSHAMDATDDIIRLPTMMSAGAVAPVGIAPRKRRDHHGQQEEQTG